MKSKQEITPSGWTLATVGNSAVKLVQQQPHYSLLAKFRKLKKSANLGGKGFLSSFWFIFTCCWKVASLIA